MKFKRIQDLFDKKEVSLPQRPPYSLVFCTARKENTSRQNTEISPNQAILGTFGDFCIFWVLFGKVFGVKKTCFEVEKLVLKYLFFLTCFFLPVFSYLFFFTCLFLPVYFYLFIFTSKFKQPKMAQSDLKPPKNQFIRWLQVKKVTS